MSDSKLERLRQKQLQLANQIKQLEAQELKQKRKDDTRRKILVGAAILAKVERGEWSQDGFRKMMDLFLDKPIDRKLFDLDIPEQLSEEGEEAELSPEDESTAPDQGDLASASPVAESEDEDEQERKERERRWASKFNTLKVTFSDQESPE